MPVLSLNSEPTKLYDLDAARKAGIPEDQILQSLRGRVGNYDFDKALKSGIPPSQINDSVVKKLNDPQFNIPLLKQSLSDARDKIIDQTKPIFDGLATMYGSMNPLGPAAGIPAGVATDAVLQKLQSDKAQAKNRTTLADITGTNKGSAGETLANAFQNETLNELFTKLGTFVMGKVGSMINPTSINPELEKLQPTFSQYGKNPKSIASRIENIWNPAGKNDAVQNSAGLARNQFNTLVKSTTGNRLTDPATLANDARNVGRIAIDNLNDRFQSGKDAVQAVGKLNSQEISPSIDLVKPNGFLDDQNDGNRYLNNIVSGVKDSHIISGSIPAPLSRDINGTGLNLYKNGAGDFILGEESPNVGIKVFGKISNKAGNKGIENLAISPVYQNKGLAQVLLKASDDAGFPIKSVQGNGISNDGAKAINTYLQSKITPQQIEGPINLQNTSQEAAKFLADRAKFYGNDGFSNASDSDKKLIQQAQLLLQHSDHGKSPIPFKDAIDILHGPNGDAGLEGMSRTVPGEISETKNIQDNLADSLHKDIQSSIKGWDDPANTAINGYNDARTAIHLKNQLYEGGNLQNLIEENDSPISAIDNTLKDPSKTQRLLNASQFNGLKSNNMRQDLAGYRLNQIWQSADNGVKGIDGDKLINEWNNPDFQKTKDLLFSQSSQSRIEDFFRNVSKVSTQGQQGNYQNMRITMRGVEIASSILAGAANPIHSIGTFAAMEIPMMGIARLLTNPAKAAVLQRLVSGAPLEASEAQAGRILMSGLNGITVYLKNQDGKQTPAIIREGKIQPLE